MTISWWILLRIRNVSNRSCRKNQNTHFMFNNCFRKSCFLWDNVKKYGHKLQYGGALHAGLVPLNSRSTCQRPFTHTHTHTHSPTHTSTYAHTNALAHTDAHKYARLTAFPPQQWFLERASMLRYTYIVCLVRYNAYIMTNFDTAWGLQAYCNYLHYL
jgi:hypothetical protein